MFSAMAEDLVHPAKRIKRKSFKSLSSTTTHINVMRHRHTWTIDNYSFCSKGKAKLKSPTFLAGTNGMEWRLELNPNGDRNTSLMTLYLVLVNCHMNEIHADYTFGIVNAEGKDVSLASSKHDCKVADISNNVTIIMKDLFKEESKVLLDDKLTIFCEITATTNSDNISETLTAPQIDLVKDVKFMLENKEGCDVTLSTGSKNFLAHKFVLRARSPVFKAMFEHDMEESRNNRVEITDIDDEGLGEMLRYMYTGEIHNLKEIAPRLITMADKYQMDDLKIMCEKALLENLSHENAAENLIFSETFCAAEVMDQVKDFIVVHAAEVGKTHGFESMVLTHPHLALEAFRACTK